MRLRTLGAVMAVAAGSACGGGESGGAAPAASSPTSTAPTPPTVSMTIADHSPLTRAVPWQVMAKAAGDDFVSEVDYLVDGKTMWVEHNAPYFFDDDHQVLAPWLLGEGTHVLTAHVVTVDGATADVTAHVGVRMNVAADKQIAGTYHRLVTRADQRRTEAYRVPSKGAFGEESPTGRWTLHVKANGEIVGVDPTGNEKNPFVEPFTLTGSSMTLYGPAVWRQPNPDEPNLFCEPEKAGHYTWSLDGSSLTITAKDKVCADRDIVFVGTWTR